MRGCDRGDGDVQVALSAAFEASNRPLPSTSSSSKEHGSMRVACNDHLSSPQHHSIDGPPVCTECPPVCIDLPLPRVVSFSTCSLIEQSALRAPRSTVLRGEAPKRRVFSVLEKRQKKKKREGRTEKGRGREERGERV